jgi:hypothetical protein
MKTINNDLIRSFNPCYDPSEVKIPDGETLSVLDWVEKYRSIVMPKDIIWLLCHSHFLTDRDLLLFAVWCAREALSLTDSPDPRSVAAIDVAERYANSEASLEELQAVADSAIDFVTHYPFERAAYFVVTRAARASNVTAYSAAGAATRAGVDRDKQIDKLLTYFK